MSQLVSDPILENEVIAGLEDEYYQEDWDSSSYWIQKLGESVNDLETIDASRKDLMKRLTTVSRRCVTKLFDFFNFQLNYSIFNIHFYQYIHLFIIYDK